MHYKKEHGDFPAGFEGMAILVVNFPREGYKTKYIFGKNQQNLMKLLGFFA